MKIIQVYIIAITEFFFVFVVKSFLHVLIICSIEIRVFLLKHLFYFNFIHRHSFLNFLKKIHFFAQLIKIAINVFFLNFQAFFISKTNTRVEIFFWLIWFRSSLVHIFSFFNNLTEMILKTHRQLYCLADIMSFALMLFHVLVFVSDRTSFSSGNSANLYSIMMVS